MRYKFLFLIPSFLFISLTASECKKHKPGNPIDQLPPETQTGANTFGCLINGEIFLPKGPSLGPILQCAYQYLDNSYDHGYFFQLGAIHKNKTTDVLSVGIFTDSLTITNGTFTLGNNQKGNAYALYTRATDTVHVNLYTSNDLPGQLTITKFDETNQIVSGTFWFSVVKSPGDTIKITDGRFDMQFTK